MTFKIDFKTIEDKFLWLVTLFMFSSLYIFSTQSWGRYVLAISSVVVFSFGVLLNGGISFKLKLNMFHIIQLIICIYCLFSCIWAINPNGALSRSYSMLQFLIFFSMLMAYFIKLESIDPLLDIVMWSGYAVSIYTIYYYGGISKIMNYLVASQRLENQFCNVNLIGMLCAVACIIQFYKILYFKSYFSSCFMLPAIIVLAACQSRKSIIMLVLGIVAVIILKNINNKNWIISTFKTIISLFILFYVIKHLLSLEIFSGLNYRLASLFSGFTAEGMSANSSTATRFNYIDIGFQYFLDRPLFGYGFASSSTILLSETSDSTYFHNNFIELLVNGGVVGFSLYYFNYLYLIYNLIKYRKHSVKQTGICLIILFILLLMDYGIVSFVEKIQYFYFMICYIQVGLLKKERKKTDENVQNFQKIV